jgi:vacuolar-type H+-ATPase subunit E/Vma4
MSLEGIIDRIISDANRDAEAILSEAGEREKALMDEAAREAEEFYRRQRDLLEEKARREKERAILNRRLEQRKRILQSRQKWMDRAFQEAYDALLEQPEKDYRTLMVDLILRASSSRDEAVLFGTKGSAREMKEIVDGANKKSGGKFTLQKGRGDFPWGFILRKGKVETNMSIDSLFTYRRSDLEQRAWEIFNAR